MQKLTKPQPIRIGRKYINNQPRRSDDFATVFENVDRNIFCARKTKWKLMEQMVSNFDRQNGKDSQVTADDK